MKKVIFYFITITFPLILIELFFQILPVSHPPYILKVDQDSPVARLQPNIDYVWSKGWDFNILTKKRTNNFGFTNDQNYLKSTDNPLMIIIGDSFVEANQIENDKTMSGILSKKVKDEGRVYSIGLSGAPLSQYLVFAEYARHSFSPDSMVFIIIGNDFVESMLKYNRAPRFHYFMKQNDKYVLHRIDYDIGITKKLLRNSSFIRYIMLNLEIKRLFKPRPVRPKEGPMEFVGYIPRYVSDEYLNDSKIAINEFFRQLPIRSGLDSQNILFVIDGIRPNLYNDSDLAKAKGSYLDLSRTYFIQNATALGYEVRDIQPAFIRKNRLDGTTFEFPTDGHWNEAGHKLVASEISCTRVYKRTFDAGENSRNAP